METKKPWTRIGYIYADIAGDSRYGQTLSVWYDGIDARLVVKENGAVSGSDGPGSSMPWEDQEASVIKKATPKKIIDSIRFYIDSRCCSTIKEYGKPSKNFKWGTSYHSDPFRKGISTAKCKVALAAYEQQHELNR